MAKILIVVDMQVDFITGPLGNNRAKSIVPGIKDLATKYVNEGGYVIYTMDTHYENYLETQEGRNLPTPHCLWGTEGWKLYADVVPDLKDIKTNPNSQKRLFSVQKGSFGYRDWEHMLSNNVNEEIDSIEIVGVCTGICVISNALILKSLFKEVPISVNASLCGCINPTTHRNALETMRLCQIEITNDK